MDRGPFCCFSLIMKPVDSQLQWYTHFCQIKVKWEHWLPLLPGFCNTEVSICLNFYLLQSSFILYLQLFLIHECNFSEFQVLKWIDGVQSKVQKKGWVAVLQSWKGGGSRAPENLPRQSSFCFISFLLLLALANTPVTKLSGFFFLKTTYCNISNVIWKCWRCLVHLNCYCWFHLFCYVVQYWQWYLLIFRSFSFYFVSVQIKLTTWLSWF